MKATTKLLPLPFLFGIGFANTPPTVVVESAAMRPGTTLMDVVYHVDDPDDPTVKVRALAFVDGVRSFANVLRPVTFAEGTDANLGDAIPANTNHTLTWDVAADWSADLGQIKFEILARDSRGLLEFDWLTIPATGDERGMTISQNAPEEDQLMDALYWIFADGNDSITLENGILTGNANCGVLDGIPFASGSTLHSYAAGPLVYRTLNMDRANCEDFDYISHARAGVVPQFPCNAVVRPFTESTFVVVGWGDTQSGQAVVPKGLMDVESFAAGRAHSLFQFRNGLVVGWGANDYGQLNVPAGLHEPKALAAGDGHSMALKSDGTVVVWGRNDDGQRNVPAGLDHVTAIAAGDKFCLALKDDGNVVAWGDNISGQTDVPANLSDVTAISAGNGHCLALKSDGTVAAWGYNFNNQAKVPAGLSGVVAVAAGGYHSLALKSDGTVVAWGYFFDGATTVPGGLNNVTTIAGGRSHSLALKDDGTVVAWGHNVYGQSTVPAGLSGVTAIAARGYYSLALIPITQ